MTLLGFLHLWSPQSWWWCWLWVCRKGGGGGGAESRAGSQAGEGAEENGATVAGVQGAPWWALRLILQSLSAEGNSEYHEGDLAAASSHGWQPWPQPLLSISNVKTNIFLITISVHMFHQCSNDFSSNLKWYEIFRRLSRTIFLMHAEKYYSDDTGTLKLKYSSSKKVCRVSTPCTSYSLNTHTPPPNSCPPNGTNRTFSYFFYQIFIFQVLNL